jgi:hypothetical protein
VQLPHPEVLSRVARIECIAEATLLVRPLKSLDPRKFRGHIFRRHLNNVQQGTPWTGYQGGPPEDAAPSEQLQRRHEGRIRRVLITSRVRFRANRTSKPTSLNDQV